MVRFQRRSAGLLIYKFSKEGNLKFFIVHPGGLFWKDREIGAWSIPKGEIEEGEEDLLEVAKRELKEETGIDAPEDEEEFIDLGEVTQKSGKVVRAWAFEGDWTGLLMCSSWVDVEWNGQEIRIPEIDKAGFFSIEKVKVLINPAQVELVERLVGKINAE
ncbi:MAG: NUDIX domain-containing protein [Nanoarchaeota archaeon]|nr:NUDIX domain-containing protein [Nanoarchaeota archaeon]MBU0977675.1 NUDIX domain-containing protein [Nanoarchaeota archaeon]